MCIIAVVILSRRLLGGFGDVDRHVSKIKFGGRSVRGVEFELLWKDTEGSRGQRKEFSRERIWG